MGDDSVLIKFNEENKKISFLVSIKNANKEEKKELKGILKRKVKHEEEEFLYGGLPEDERNHKLKFNDWIQKYGHYKNFMKNLTCFRDSSESNEFFFQTGCRAEYLRGFTKVSFVTLYCSSQNV